jgi:hypothetical protein
MACEWARTLSVPSLPVKATWSAQSHEPMRPLERRSDGLISSFYSAIARSHGRTRVGMECGFGSEVHIPDSPKNDADF